MQWQYEYQFVLCALSAVRLVTADILGTDCNILCFNKQCICWQK